MAEPCVGGSTIVTWALVFGGWLVVHRAALSRERRKEKREAVRQFCIELRSVERQAIDVHTADIHNSRQATDVCQELERLILQLQRPPLEELEIPYSRMIQLRRSITRRNIDPSDFVAQPAASDLVREIRNAVADLIEAVEQRREQRWT